MRGAESITYNFRRKIRYFINLLRVDPKTFCIGGPTDRMGIMGRINKAGITNTIRSTLKKMYCGKLLN